MAMTAEETQAFNDLKSQLATAQSQLSAKDAQITTLTADLASVRSENTTLSSQLTTANTQLTLKTTENETLRAENTTLASAQAEIKAQQVDARVTDAIKTYGTKKGLTEASRKMLTHLCANVPEEFEREYPPVAQENQHLLHNHTERGSKDPKGGAGAAPDQDLPVVTLASLGASIAAERKIPLDRAMLEAEKILNKGSRKG